MDDVAENMRLLAMIREDQAWALARVKTAAEKEAEAKRYREALEKIASQDFRGNRSTESQIAYSALHGCPHPLHLTGEATPCPNCMGWIPKA